MDNKTPLLRALLDYHKEKNLILSMPGNKCGIGFLRDEIGEEFVRNLGFLDITEVDPLDNLHSPEGVIKEAQELLRKTYGAKKAYFTVNGSSSGNLASIFSAFNEGDEVLVERNCHKSIYNALILRKLKVTYIEPGIDKKKNILLPPDKEKIYEALEKCENPKGVILTYPNYYGITYDIENILKDFKEKAMKIVIDAAHGAHFIASEKLPKSIYSLGDYVVLSAHKTLPSLTQGGYLLVNDEEDRAVEFYLKTFMTTSPSYLVMASLDYGRYYLDRYAKVDYKKLILLANEWRDKINELNKVFILSQKDLYEGYDVDESRYLVLLPEGYSGHKLLDYLRERTIQAEMSFASGVVLILSPFNENEDFMKIFNAIKSLDMKMLQDDNKVKYFDIIPEKKLEPYEAFNRIDEMSSIEEAVGKVAKENIVPYPPGIPLVCAGEIITKKAIDIILDYICSGKSVIGVYEGEIKVIK